MTSTPSLQPSLLKPYLLDANVFIAAWRDHYPIDLHPGFWACLERYSREKRLFSVDRVRKEIRSPKELVAWLKQHWRGAFVSTRDREVAGVFSDMQAWVQSNAQFLQAAKHEFAQAADGWLAAYVKTHNAILVTNEVYNENSRRRVPLPYLCRMFDVEVCILELTWDIPNSRVIWTLILSASTSRSLPHDHPHRIHR